MPDHCTWCKAPLETVEVGGQIAGDVSGGICERCAENFLFQRGVTLRRYLDSLPIPVLVVDADVVVQMVNIAGRELLGKSDGELEQFSGGEVFECAYARRPGGCGRSVHCSGCTIRKAVKTTWETGEPQNNIPATLKPFDPASPDPAAADMTITTYKAGDRVMLRVDRLGTTGKSG